MTLRAYPKSSDFRALFATLQGDLLREEPIDVGEWQSQRSEFLMRELLNVSFAMDLPPTKESLATMTGAHLPWAEDHFLERIGGEPLNPAPSEAWWPFAKKHGNDTNSDHKSEGKAFSHTYPERMWPKHAGRLQGTGRHSAEWVDDLTLTGIRFDYGDLADVVTQLIQHEKTRQAFLPIWFPEDTGAVHGKRVPCTLGYHFLIRNNKLQITYYMRSTDLLRHFQDDIYMAGRLAQWVVTEINSHAFDDWLGVGELIFHTANLHIFNDDVPMIEYRISQGQTAWPE